MNENMQTMTENTANELLEAFEKCNKHNEEFLRKFSDMMNNVVNDALLKTIERNMHYTERYFDAWPITRWWWKRKMDKSKADVENVRKFAEKMKVRY